METMTLMTSGYRPAETRTFPTSGKLCMAQHVAHADMLVAESRESDTRNRTCSTHRIYHASKLKHATLGNECVLGIRHDEPELEHRANEMKHEEEPRSRRRTMRANTDNKRRDRLNNSSCPRSTVRELSSSICLVLYRMATTPERFHIRRLICSCHQKTSDLCLSQLRQRTSSSSPAMF